VAGHNPGFLVGGLVRDLGVLARAAEERFFVIEGDEYDTAYFDKGPKFLHYEPAAAIVTSVEFDHADIYTDVEHVKSSFRRFAELLPADAPLVGCTAYPHLLDAVRGVGGGRFIGYGARESSDPAQTPWTFGELREDGESTSFRPYYREQPQDLVQLRVPGAMNALNATAVLALTSEFGVDQKAVRDALSTFRGAARRQEVLGNSGGVIVIDDFAHHPTAVAGTLAAMRKRYPDKRIVAVFEPRSNTSRRAVFQDRYAEALAAADLVALGAVYAKPNDPLTAEEMLSTDKLLSDLREAGVEGWAADGPDAILARLQREVRSGDVVVCMSNGAFGGLPRRLLASL
jgi:UDP-N-acetylmuramate: L-alanyl-gamma-D-glutamyl-meso-diaminopimelate ligase